MRKISDIKTILDKKREKLNIGKTDISLLLNSGNSSVTKYFDISDHTLPIEKLLLLCGLLEINLDSLLDEKNHSLDYLLNEKKSLVYGDFLKFLGNNSLIVDDNNIKEFVDLYVAILSRLRELYSLDSTCIEFDKLKDFIFSSMKTSLKIKDFDRTGNEPVLFIEVEDIKIFKINNYFDIENLDYICVKKIEFEDNDPFNDEDNEEKKIYKWYEKSVISKETRISYSKKPYLLNGKKYSNHDEINSNTYYVIDHNGFDAVIQIINTEDNDVVEYLFDCHYDYLNIDDSILDLCKNNPDALEKYLHCLTKERYSKIEERYDKFYYENGDFGNVFYKMNKKYKN